MQSVALSPTKQAVLAAFYAPVPKLTLIDELDDAEDFEPLDALVRQYAGEHCLRIDFYDDNFKRGYRAIYYKATVPVTNGRVECSEDGKRPDSDEWEEIVDVKIIQGMSIEVIARMIASEVRAIEGNLFA